MPLEVFTFISSLVRTNPAGTDGVNQGDDHIRGVKLAVQDSFPLIDAAVNCTPADLNQLAGTAVAGSGLSVTGMIMAYASSGAPDGWLKCDGGLIDGAHTALIALIGTNTPDLRGQFLRGISDDNSVDPDGPRAELDAQADLAGPHTHPSAGAHTHVLQTNSSGSNGQNFDSSSSAPSTSAPRTNSINALSNGAHTHPANTGAETRPVNVAVNYLIKT